MRILLPVVTALALCANAQENERPSYMRISPVLNALDTDRDGAISGDEIRHAPEALRKLDKNGDGMLTREEYSANFGGRGPGRGPEGRGAGRGEGRGEGPPPDPSNELVETLMGFDKNHDGKISKSELPERMQGMFDRGDTNKDGFLTPDEILRMAAAQAPVEDRGEGRGEGEGRGRGRGPGVDPVIAALDTNHDGVISADEIAHAPESLKTLDRDGDGQITEDEVRPAFGRGPGGGRGNPNGPPQRQ